MSNKFLALASGPLLRATLKPKPTVAHHKDLLVMWPVQV